MRRLDDRGQVLAWAVISLMLVLGMAGLALDGGFFLEGKRRAQTAADAAAMAGAAELWRAPTPNVISAAQMSASLNGYTNGTDNVTVTVNNPPSTGNYAGNVKFVEAIVSQQKSTMLLGALGITSMTPAARAVAGPASALCLQTLNPANTSVTLSGSATLSAPSCEVVVDSAGPNPISTSGSASLSASSIDVVASSASCACTPAPLTGILMPPDPFAALSPPAFTATCPATLPNNHYFGTLDPSYTAGGTLVHGPYYGGITISSVAATLNPGIYILMGGGLTISGGSANVTGAGVSFYNTGGPGDPPGSNKCGFGGVTISGGGTVTLTAPTSGSMAGILFFQDRNDPVKAVISGGSTVDLEGALYFPIAPVEFSGGSNNSASCTVIVSDTIKFTGPSFLNNDCSGFGSAIASSVALAE